MSVLKIDADYNDSGPVVTNADHPTPTRLLIQTRDSMANVRLSRDEYDAVLDAAESANDAGESKERDLEAGTVNFGSDPKSSEDPWEVVFDTPALGYRFTLSENELGKFVDLLQTVHPEYDTTAADNPNVEAE